MKGFQYYQDKLKKLLSEHTISEFLEGKNPNLKRDNIQSEIDRSTKI